MYDFDIAIIGAGPIGIELAVALKRTGLSHVHFDAKQVGYTISWFAPQTRFFSSNDRIAIAGVPLHSPDQTKSTREQYLAYLRGVVDLFDLDIRTYEPVTNIQRDGEGFVVTTAPPGGERTTRTPNVVLATGGTAVPRRLGIPGEDLPHVSAYFQDPHTYFRKRLLVIGGGNSAVEAMLRCHHAGAKVTLVHRAEKLDAASIKYWLAPEIEGLLKSGAIYARFGAHVVAIGPDRVTIRRSDGSTDDVPADFVLSLIGYEADMGLCRLAGVELSQPGNVPRFDPATMRTSVAGIYVCGTVVGGTQEKYRVFIENCHIHVERIVAALSGRSAPPAPAALERPES